jgi:hypothetical protein
MVACLTVLWPRLLEPQARRLCVISAIAFVGYSIFLLLAYIVTFTDYEAVRAASFWRYSTHLGLLGVVTAVAVMLPYWRWRNEVQRVLATVAIVILLAMPVATAKWLRFDLDHPHDGYIMAVAREMRGLLPAGVPVFLVDLYGNGSDLILMRHDLLFKPGWDVSRKHGTVTLVFGTGAVPGAIGAGAYVYLEKGGPEMHAVFGFELSALASYLMVHDLEGFHVLHTLPNTSGTDVFQAEDLK